MRSVAVHSNLCSEGWIRPQAKSSRTQEAPVSMKASTGRLKEPQSGQRITPAIPKGDVGFGAYAAAAPALGTLRLILK